MTRLVFIMGIINLHNDILLIEEETKKCIKFRICGLYYSAGKVIYDSFKTTVLSAICAVI